MSDASSRRPLISGTLAAGDEIDGRYRIVRRLGSGAMGAVYEAEQITLHKRVALKIMHPERADVFNSAKRFLREARAASVIEHRNVVDIVDFGELPDGTTYLVMELLLGTDLATYLKLHGPQGWPRTRGILLQVLRGLKAAHEHKIIHRDIKPANIFLLDPDDEYADDERIKVLDFGIARFEQADDETQELTGTSELLGTVTYMAPELARKGLATVQSDLYAVGILAYKMLTGVTPFRGGAVQVLFAHIHDPPLPPRSLVPEIPQAVEAVIMRTLAKDPSERFQSADELGRALVSIDDDGSISSRELSDILRTPSFPPMGSSSSILRTPTIAGDAGRGSDSEMTVQESRPRMVAPSRSGTSMVVGIVLGAVAVLALGVVAWIWFWPERPTAPTESSLAASGVPPPPSEPSQAKADAPAEPAAAATSGGEGTSTGPTPVEAAVEPGRGAQGASGTGTGEGTEGEPASASSGQPEPEPAPEPAPRGRGRRPRGPGTDAAVKTKLRKRARRRCEALGAGQAVTVSFTIAANGKVLMASAEPPHAGSALGQCATGVVSKAQFREGEVRTGRLVVKL